MQKSFADLRSHKREMFRSYVTGGESCVMWDAFWSNLASVDRIRRIRGFIRWYQKHQKSQTGMTPPAITCNHTFNIID
jgi:hypothetical protein